MRANGVQAKGVLLGTKGRRTRGSMIGWSNGVHAKELLRGTTGAKEQRHCLRVPRGKSAGTNGRGGRRRGKGVAVALKRLINNKRRVLLESETMLAIPLIDREAPKGRVEAIGDVELAAARRQRAPIGALVAAPVSAVAPFCKRQNHPRGSDGAASGGVKQL